MSLIVKVLIGNADFWKVTFWYFRWTIWLGLVHHAGEANATGFDRERHKKQRLKPLECKACKQRIAAGLQLPNCRGLCAAPLASVRAVGLLLA